MTLTSAGLTGLMALCPLAAFASPDLRPLARKALKAWEKGESGGGYAAFRRLLSPAFDEFAHSFVGVRTGPDARRALDAMMADRDKNPDHLRFQAPDFAQSGDRVFCAYKAYGTVGRFKIDGVPVVIAYRFKAGKIVGASEHIASVDPAWFAPPPPEKAPERTQGTTLGFSEATERVRSSRGPSAKAGAMRWAFACTTCAAATCRLWCSSRAGPRPGTRGGS